MAVSLGLTGDVMLGRLVDEHQHRRPVTVVWGDMLPAMRTLDCLLINLECCLSTRGRPWRRTNRTFHFRADPDWAIPALQRAGVDCCALANNHVLDFEEPALLDTLGYLDEGGIARAGAGRTRLAAFEPAVLSPADVTVAVVSLTDNTPEYAATERSPGTAHVDIDVDDEETRKSVAGALDRARSHDPDVLVASLHWGPNWVERPPDAHQEFAHWLVDEGVDVVHGHSAHIFQGVEVYNGRPICYDMGDFVDDYAVSEPRNDRSFLFEVRLGDSGRPTELRLHPTQIFDFSVQAARPTAVEWSRNRMRTLSDPSGTTFERDSNALVCALG